MARTLRCPYCGAEFQVPETVSIAVCPYCGTTIWVQTGSVFKEHYIYPIMYEYNRAYDFALGVAERQFASPADLRSLASPSAGMLHFVPLYLYHVRVVASCPENPEAGLEEAWVSRLATATPPRGLGSRYRFPTRGRRFFEPRTLKRGRYYQPDLDPGKLVGEVSALYVAKAMREAYNWCDQPSLKDETKWIGIVHYPFWEVHYKYRGRDFYALVDASDGTVVYLEYPLGTTKRGILLGSAAALTLGGLAIGAGLGAAAGSAAAGAIGGLVAGLPGAYNFLRLGAARIGKYLMGRRLGGED